MTGRTDGRPEDHRYARLEQTDWWDGARVRGARALVAGAGALGNEVVKNLLLLGWGAVVVVDHDRIEASNLTRAVLFGAADVGRGKAATMAANAARLNPDPRVVGLDGDLRTEVSAGLLSRMDVVFGCLDNLAARVALGQLAGRSGRLYVDGGLTGWEGTVRVFGGGDGPCYACALSAADLRELTLRRSCLAYQTRAGAAAGVATTPTVASLAGATMVQQALKWLHRDRPGLTVATGRELRWDTAHDRFWRVDLPRDAQCPLHPEPVVPVRDPALTWELSWAGILAACAADPDHPAPAASLHLPVPVLERWSCPACGAADEVAAAFPGDRRLACPECGTAAVPELTNVVTGDEPWAALSPARMAFPPWTWVDATSGDAVRTYELAGAPAALAPLDRPGDR